MPRLLIVGAGGFGREMLEFVLDLKACAHPDWEIGGFLDANPALRSETIEGYSVVGDPETYVPNPDDRFVCALGFPGVKRRVCGSLKARGAAFLTLVHPGAYCGREIVIGEGSIICWGAAVTTNVRLGEFVTININATVGHDAVVGSWSTLNPHSDVLGRVTIGDGVLLGSHAAVLPGLTIGSDAVVGAGSVAYRNVPPAHTVVGVPAKDMGAFSVGERKYE
jgi:sugar O-acyltransferase (sialic acid O-acetyltransferase NeuD family)